MKRTTWMLLALTLLLVGTGPTAADTIKYSGMIVDYTVPQTGEYQLVAAGAQGGSGPGEFGKPGGMGAVLGGTISLSAGTVLQIAVGQQGDFGGLLDFALAGGGGGGGTFIYTSGPMPLLVAGGGGGGYYLGTAPAGGTA